jgi:hypothetical protein
VDNQSELDPERRDQPPPAAEEQSDACAAQAPAGPRDAASARAVPDVTDPVWRLPPEQRAILLRIVQAGGRVQCQGPARAQISALCQAGYLRPYGEGTLILTPAALRAIAAEIDRRAASGGQAAADTPAEDPVAAEPAAEDPTDGGPTDGGPTDGGPTDGGPTDGGPTDGGPTDGGPTDGGPTDGAEL